MPVPHLGGKLKKVQKLLSAPVFAVKKAGGDRVFGCGGVLMTELVFVRFRIMGVLLL